MSTYSHTKIQDQVQAQFDLSSLNTLSLPGIAESFARFNSFGFINKSDRSPER